MKSAFKHLPARGALLLTLGALLLGACTTGQQGTQPTSVTGAQPTSAADTSVSLQDIVDNTSSYNQQTVTVNGKVNTIVSPRAFTIGGDTAGTEALVVSRQPLDELIDGQQAANTWVNGMAQVTGQVRPFDLAMYEQELGVDLRDELLQGWAGKPAIMLDELELTPGLGGTGDTTTGAVTVAQIMENPAAYLGKTVTIEGEVQEVMSPNAFKLDEESLLTGGVDNDLLVLGAGQDLSSIDDQVLNDRVRVTGIVQNFAAADIEQQIGADLNDALFTDWNDKPVLIASQVSMLDASTTDGGTMESGATTVPVAP